MKSNIVCKCLIFFRTFSQMFIKLMYLFPFPFFPAPTFECTFCVAHSQFHQHFIPNFYCLDNVITFLPAAAFWCIVTIVGISESTFLRVETPRIPMETCLHFHHLISRIRRVCVHLLQQLKNRTDVASENLCRKSGNGKRSINLIQRRR